MNNKKTNMKTVYGTEFWVVKRPLLYYVVSVLSDNGHGRRRCTAPVSMYCDDADIRIDDISPGETIIACVPAVSGSYEIFVEWNAGKYVDETTLGIEVPGADYPNWDYVAEKYIKKFVCAPRNIAEE